MNIYVQGYCWAIIAFGIAQTMVIIKHPPELSRYAAMFYIATPFLPLVAAISMPLVLYKGIESAWLSELKKYRLRVKRH